MLKFSTKEVLAKAKQEREKPKLLPKIKVLGKVIPKPIKKVKITENSAHSFTDGSEIVNKDLKDNNALDELWEQMGSVKRKRAQLSSSIADRVRMKASRKELEILYNHIEALTQEAQDLYVKIRHVEQYGELPSTQKRDNSNATDIYQLKDKKRKLTDLISKTKAKLNKSVKSKPAKINEWKMKLAQAQEELMDVQHKLKWIE